MEQKSRIMLKILVILCVLAITHLLPSVVTAEIYNTDIIFNTSGQNMWGAGSAWTFDYNKFLGFQGSKSFEIDGITDWSGNHNWVGASLYADANWKAGIDVGASINSGSVDVAYPVAVSLDFPSVITAGGLFTIGSSFSLLPGASLNTIFPNITPQATAILQLGANVDLEGCWYTGCDRWNVIDLHASYEKNLLDFLSSVPTNPGDSATYALPNGWGTIEATIPDDLNTIGTTSGNNLVSRTGEFSGEFLDAELNLLKLGELIPGPVGRAIKTFNDLEEGEWYIHPDPFHARISWNAIDLGAGAITRVTQAFQFVPDLSVDLLTNDGGIFTSFKVGDTVTLTVPDGVGSDFQLTPEFSLNNSFTNKTGLRIDPVFSLLVLEASYAATVHEIWFHVEDSFGPLFEDQWVVHGLDIPIYSNIFSLDFPSFEGNPFSIQVGPEPVPEPTTMLLLGSGLIGLLGYGRRFLKK